MCEVKIKSGREKSLLRHHPWIFASAIDSVHGSPIPGEIVKISDKRGEFLGWGAYNHKSKIRVRVWSWEESEIVSRSFFKRKFLQAFSNREMYIKKFPSNAFRLINAESDGLPGLVVDKYRDTCVVQFLSAGVERWRNEIIDLLIELCRVENIYERSDADVRELEGLSKLTGPVFGDYPHEFVEVNEGGINYYVDIQNGHKTGFYLDQKVNRLLLREFVRGKKILDCFCYTGGFSLNALMGNAKTVVAIDTSKEALTIAKENEKNNSQKAKAINWVEGDVFKQLRTFRDANEKFDLIILDPPKFAPTPANLHRAARGYKDINLLAFKLLRDRGILFTFSCSGGVDQKLFQKIVADAALDAGVDTQIIDFLYQSPDHPVALNFPEGFYLKGLVVAVKK